MLADEIRGMKCDDRSDQQIQISIFKMLQEIAANLAEMNERERSKLATPRTTEIALSN